MIKYLNLNKLFYIILLIMVLMVSCAGGKLKMDGEPISNTEQSLLRYDLDKLIYSCHISGGYLWKKYSLSGLLLIKKMDDESRRVVFQNEMGMTFFDLEWNRNLEFKVVNIIDKMNHDALIKTLRKDFEVLLRLYSDEQLENLKGNASFVQLPLAKGKAFYTFQDQKLLQNIYIVDNDNKKIVSFLTTPFEKNDLPLNMSINHHKANFFIHLKQLQQ